TFSSESALVQHALDQMDLWLTGVVADTSADSLQAKVVRSKPATLREGCVPPGSQYPSFVAQTLEIGSGSCATSYPVGIGTRAAAGGPVVADIVKCQLKSVDAAFADNDYRVTFTSDQRNRLRAIFPTGVCDWSKPGVGQPSSV